MFLMIYCYRAQIAGENLLLQAKLKAAGVDEAQLAKFSEAAAIQVSLVAEQIATQQQRQTAANTGSSPARMQRGNLSGKQGQQQVRKAPQQQLFVEIDDDEEAEYEYQLGLGGAEHSSEERAEEKRRKEEEELHPWITDLPVAGTCSFCMDKLGEGQATASEWPCMCACPCLAAHYLSPLSLSTHMIPHAQTTTRRSRCVHAGSWAAHTSTTTSATTPSSWTSTMSATTAYSTLSRPGTCGTSALAPTETSAHTSARR